MYRLCNVWHTLWYQHAIPTSRFYPLLDVAFSPCLCGPSWRSCSILWQSSGGMQTLYPFNSKPSSTVSSSLAPQKWHAIWETLWMWLGQPLSVIWYTVWSIQTLSVALLVIFILCGVKLVCCMFWCNSIGKCSLLEGNLLNLSAKTISFPSLCVMF